MKSALNGISLGYYIMKKFRIILKELAGWGLMKNSVIG